jgi:hypothetical protein
MPNEKSCSYCGSQIPAGATVCSVCKYHQNRWRNNLLFAAGLAGLVGLFGSALTFTIGTSLQLYKSLKWTDRATVLKLRSVGLFTELVIANSGDGPIFITDVDVGYRGTKLATPMQKALAINEIATIRDGDDSFLKEGTNTVFQNKTGIPSQDVLDSWRTGPDGFGHKFCFLVSYHSENDPVLVSMRKAPPDPTYKFVTEPAEAYVRYFSPLSGKRLEETVAVTAVFVISKSADCAAKFLRARQ